jgi:hypothetical protein
MLGSAFLTSGTNEGTNTETYGMETDHKKNLPYKPATLRDRDKDLSKEWYVEWYAFDEAENAVVRKRKKIPMSYQDVKSRTQAGKQLVAKVNKLLASGYHFKKLLVTNENPLSENQDLINVLNHIINLEKPVIAAKTVITYQSAVNKLESFAGTNRLQVADFKMKNALHFRDYLITTSGNSPRTANNTLQHLAAIFGR